MSRFYSLSFCFFSLLVTPQWGLSDSAVEALSLSSEPDKKLQQQIIQQDKDLRALEWFAEEYLHKAQRAQLDQDWEKVSFFLHKADKSLQKSYVMRKQVVKNWHHLQNDKQVRSLWLLAIRVANVRAVVLTIQSDYYQQQLLSQTFNAADKNTLQLSYWDHLDDLSNQWYVLADYYGQLNQSSQQVLALQNALLKMSPLFLVDDETLQLHQDHLLPFFEHAFNLYDELLVLLDGISDKDKVSFYRSEKKKLQQRLAIFSS